MVNCYSIFFHANIFSLSNVVLKKIIIVYLTVNRDKLKVLLRFNFPLRYNFDDIHYYQYLNVTLKQSHQPQTCKNRESRPSVHLFSFSFRTRLSIWPHLHSLVPALLYSRYSKIFTVVDKENPSRLFFTCNDVHLDASTLTRVPDYLDLIPRKKHFGQCSTCYDQNIFK